MPRLTESGNSSRTNLRSLSLELHTRVLENAKLINLAELRLAGPDPCGSLPCLRSVSMLAALSLSGSVTLLDQPFCAGRQVTRMFYSQLRVHTPSLPGRTHPVGTPLHAGLACWCSGIAAMFLAHNHPSLRIIFLEMPAKAPSSLVRDCVL